MNNFKLIDNLKTIDFENFQNLIKNLLDCTNPPDNTFFKHVLSNVLVTLNNEDIDIRPRDNNNKPGGLIYLKTFKKVVILPDLHARRHFLKSALYWKINNVVPLIKLLEEKQIALLCLGDGVHSEAQNYNRWMSIFDEFLNEYKKCPNMNAEIADSFNLMLAVMCLKIRYKNNFHFLKGNHENIRNETENGNYAFTKFCNEGAIVLDYFNKFYDNKLLLLYYEFEKNIPLFAVGRNFLASHSEPKFNFDKKRIINFHKDSELIEGLTWTENNESEKGTVDKLISYFLPDNYINSYYFGGHRYINGLYNKVNNTKYIQIHNPQKKIAVLIEQDKKIKLNEAVQILDDYEKLL
ncbi:MAG: metallophosphoesterase [Melioribacteraceae bacterium]|nr:metallophosphoesterase [Melioribacteraceae bacterium]